MGEDAAMTEDSEVHRRLFHTMGGRFDIARLIEQLIPTLIAAVLVAWVNLSVTQSQVGDMRIEMRELRGKVGDQNEKLIALNAQVAAYLGQQTQLNAAMDARLTYLERASRDTGGVTVIQPSPSATTIQPRAQPHR